MLCFTGAMRGLVQPRCTVLVWTFLLACTPARVEGPMTLEDAGPPDAGEPGCTGCIDDRARCVRGTSSTACGQDGVMCAACDDGELCTDGVCLERQSCGPDDCEGCCDGLTCVTDERDDACGGQGRACVACGAGQMCVDGECVMPAVCNPDNCDGCCDGTDCVLGDQLDACGTGGVMCAACQAGWTCEAGACVAPCAERCDGCCDGETCLLGNDDTLCGRGGESCADCGGTGVCSSGMCADRACSDTCEGCCDGDLCLSGTLSGACGAEGAACIDCGAAFDCGVGRCQVDPASRWNLTIVRATFSALDPSGSAWDSGGGAPDPFAQVRVDSAGATLTERTARIDNTTTPNWDELVHSNVRADDLMREVIIDIRDHDPISPDDPIVYCRWLPSNDAFLWGRIILSCSETTGPATIAGEVTVALERN